MDRLITAMRRPKAIILCILLGGYVLFSFLSMIAFGNFGSVGSLFSFLVLIALLGALIVAIFLKLDKVVNVLGIAIFAYWALDMALSHLPGYVDMCFSVNLDTNGAWAAIISGVFFLLAFLAALAVLVLFVLSLFIPALAGNRVVKLVGRILMLAFLGCFVVSKLFFFIGICIWGYGWGNHMSLIADLFMGCAVFYGYFLIVDRD